MILPKIVLYQYPFNLICVGIPHLYKLW